MKKLIWFTLVLVLAVWVGIYLKADPGIVIIRVSSWRVDLPLWLAILGVLLLFFIFHYILKFFAFLMHYDKIINDFVLSHKTKKARQLTNRGFIELAEGEWSKAEKHFLQGAAHSEVPLLNYLSAAKAAQELGATKRRDGYLRCAYDATEDADIAIGLTQARLQYQHRQFEQSLATVRHLMNLTPTHPHLLKLLKNIYLELKDWEQLLALLPTLRKQRVITEYEEKKLTKESYIHLIQQVQKQPADALMTLWENIPKRWQQDSDIAYRYAFVLHEQKKEMDAERILRQSLKRRWSESCIHLYGLLIFEVPQKALNQAESWLKNYPESPNLLLTLGRICVQAQLWGKAQHYLEACLNYPIASEAYAELGILLEKVDQVELSHQYFKAGLIQLVPAVPDNLPEQTK